MSSFLAANQHITGWPEKKRAELCITITVRYVYFMNEISSGTSVDHYVLLLNYKFQ